MKPVVRFLSRLLLGSAGLFLAACTGDTPERSVTPRSGITPGRSTMSAAEFDAAFSRIRAEVRAERGTPAEASWRDAPPRQQASGGSSPGQSRLQRRIASAHRHAPSNCRGVDVRPYIGTVDYLTFARAYSERDSFERAAMSEAATEIGAWGDVQHFLARNGSAMRDGGLNSGEQVGMAIATVLSGQMGYAHPDPAERDRRFALLGDMTTSVMFEYSWFCVRAAAA